MKKLIQFKLVLVAFSLIFLSSCSTQMYTFAPGTGGYHGQEKKAVAGQENNVSETELTAQASADLHAEPTIAETPASEAAAVLSNALTQKNLVTEKPAKAEVKNAKQDLKQIRQDVKQLKKKVKETQKTQVNSSVKLLLVLGLVLILLGLVLPILYTIGVILVVIGLVLLILDAI